MDFSNRLRTHAEPVGMTVLYPMRLATVTAETYGGDVVTDPGRRRVPRRWRQAT